MRCTDRRSKDLA